MQEEPSFDANETTGPTGKQVIDEMNNRYGFFKLAWTWSPFTYSGK